MVTFSGADAGVGLWSLSESGNVNFNPDAILYGIASDSGCSDVSFLNHLDPQETEPFDLSFQFSDASQNGKYLCIILKDKLGNTQTGYLSSPINLDLGAPFLPLLSDQTATL